MKNIPVPGFQAYLNRTFPEKNETSPTVATMFSASADKVTPEQLEILGAQLFGDKIIVEYDASKSSSIARLEYDTKKGLLVTTFKTGKSYPYSDVTLEEFRAVVNPGKEYEGSIGRAHYAIIVQKRKVKTA